jgi:hypothetical protein
MFVHYDETTGDILGFYSPEIHGENMPTPNIEVTETIWLDLLENTDIKKIHPETQQVITAPSNYHSWNGTTWVVDMQQAKKDKRNEIARSRYEEETSGIEIDGYNINTDRESQSLITAAAFTASLDPAYICRWKTKNGFVTLDANTIIQIATAVRNHVQECFNKEDTLTTQIDNANDIESLEAVVW